MAIYRRDQSTYLRKQTFEYCRLTASYQAYNDTVYDWVMFALNKPNGCLDQIDICRSVEDINSLSGQAICAEAADMCRDNVSLLLSPLREFICSETLHRSKDLVSLAVPFE